MLILGQDLFEGALESVPVAIHILVQILLAMNFSFNATSTSNKVLLKDMFYYLVVIK